MYHVCESESPGATGLSRPSTARRRCCRQTSHPTTSAPRVRRNPGGTANWGQTRRLSPPIPRPSSSSVPTLGPSHPSDMEGPCRESFNEILRRMVPLREGKSPCPQQRRLGLGSATQSLKVAGHGGPDENPSGPSLGQRVRCIGGDVVILQKLSQSLLPIQMPQQGMSQLPQATAQKYDTMLASV